jgi:hypothetical protein
MLEKERQYIDSISRELDPGNEVRSNTAIGINSLPFRFSTLGFLKSGNPFG